MTNLGIRVSLRLSVDIGLGHRVRLRHSIEISDSVVNHFRRDPCVPGAYTLSEHEPWKRFENIRCRNELCRCHDLGRSDGVEVSHRLGDGNIVRHCIVDSAELCHRLEDSLGVALFDPKQCTQDHS